MSKLSDFLNTTHKAPPYNDGLDEDGKLTASKCSLPSIGDIVMSPSDKHRERGTPFFDLLLCDGSAVDEVAHPQLYAMFTTLPNMTSPDAAVPYRIVADLTGE